MFQKLRQPYPTESDPRKQWQTVIVFSLFVFLFLRFFRPFGLNEVDSSALWLVTFLLGAVTFVAMLIPMIILPLFFKEYFKEQNWTLGKEIFTTGLILFGVTMGNVMVLFIMGYAPFSWGAILFMAIFVPIIGLFPGTVIRLIRQNQLLKLHLAQASKVNQQLAKDQLAPKTIIERELITFTNETGNESLDINPNDLLYATSEGNYTLFYIHTGGLTKESRLRIRMKQVEEQLADYENLFRCHRAFIVNLDKVLAIDGNARGYLLQVKDAEQAVPVSRNNIAELNKRLHVS